MRGRKELSAPGIVLLVIFAVLAEEVRNPRKAGAASPGATAVTVSPTGRFRDVAFGDLNHDGRLDLVATSSDNNGLRAFMVDGSRRWTENSANLPTTGTYNGVALCDVDHNGWLDIIAGSNDGLGVEVFLRTGLNQWTESSGGIPHVGFNCSELVVTDLNCDGHPDIMAAMSNNAGIRIFEGDGAGGWTPRTPVVAAGSYWGLAVWDWAANGLLDVVAASRDDAGLVYWRQTGLYTFVSNNFQLPHVGNYNQLALTDVNRDGKLDILATRANRVEAFLGIDASFPPILDGLPPTGQWGGVVAGEYPPDAYADVFLGSYAGKGISAYSGLIAGQWTKQQDLTTSGTFWGLALADSDNDGAADVAGAPTESGLCVWYNAPLVLTPQWIAAAAPTHAGWHGWAVDSADIDRDGATDLLIGTNGNGMKLWAGDGGSTWTEITPAIFPNTLTVSSVCLDDFDGDFRPDAVGTGYSGRGIYCFRNLGFRNWEEKRTGLPTTEVYHMILLADLNNDGKKEIVAGHTDGGIEIYRFDSALDRWFLLTSPLTTGTPWGLAAADFNRDGLLDLAVAIESVGVRAWTQKRPAGWDPFSSGLPSGGDFRELAAADLDQDGFADLAVTFRGGGIAALRNNPATRNWTTLTSPVATADFYAVTAGDFNLDGLTDLAACAVSSGIVLLKATAPGAWELATTGSLPRNDTVASCRFAKIDRDQTPDLAAVDSVNFARVYLFGDATPPTGWTNFQPAGWTRDTTATTCTVEVFESLSGLNTASAQYQFSRNGGASWLGPFPALCTDTSPVAHTTIIASAVPFDQEGWTENKIRFFIADMAGSLGQSPAYRVQIDATAPPNPTAADSWAHQINVWSRHRIITLEWDDPPDLMSGVGGYSWEFSHGPATVPDDTIDPTPDYCRVHSPELSDAPDWYFHVRSVDRAGNAGVGALHVGPFKIDCDAPASPTLTAVSPAIRTWTADDVITVDVTPGADAGSGPAAVRYSFTEHMTCDAAWGPETSDTTIVSGRLSQGNRWYLHAQSKDAAGNYSEPAHLGPFWLDLSPPIPRIFVFSTLVTHEFQVSWGADDELSGVGGYNVQGRRVGDSDWIGLSTDTLATNLLTTGAAGQSYEFRVQARDAVNNWSEWTDPVATRLGVRITGRVQNNVGDPVGGAEVFLNDTYLGRSNASGEIGIPDVMSGDRICARKELVYWDTDRPDRSWDEEGPWCARVYITSVGVDANGNFTDVYVGLWPPDPFVMTLFPARAVVGFNLVCSVEWDASDDYLDKLRLGLERASDYLYSATDGQFFFERIDIRDNRSRWTYADIHMDGYIHTANAYTGYPLWGMNHEWSNAQMRIPQLYGGKTYEDSGAYPVFIHEFGHYGLRLKDEYEQQVYNAARARYESHDRQCTHNLLSTSPTYGWSQPQSACIMTWQNRARNFCDEVTSNTHAHDTEQHDVRGAACWPCFTADWADEDGAADWMFRRPADLGRDYYTSGPRAIPSAAWRSIEVGYRAETGAYDYLLTVLDHSTTPVKDADVTVEHIETGSTRYMGKTDGHGEILLLGVYHGDTVDVSTGTFHAIHIVPEAPGPSPGLGGKRLQRFDSVGGRPADIPFRGTTLLSAPPYQVDIAAMPGATSRTLALAVWTSAALIEPPQARVWQSSLPAGTSMTVAFTYNPATQRYEGQFQLDPAGGPRGYIRVNTLDLRGTPGRATRWFEFIDLPTSGTVLDWQAYHGEIQLWAPLTSIAPGTRLYVERAPMQGSLPPGLRLLNGPFRLAAAGSSTTLAGPAILKLSPASTRAGMPGTARDRMVIFRWEEAGGAWVPLDSTSLLSNDEISAPISGTGVYLLGFLSAPELNSEPAFTRGTSNQVSWGNTLAASQYYVECDEDRYFGSPRSSGWIGATQWMATGLTDGVIYYYRVKCVNAVGIESGWSNTVQSQQDAAGPVMAGAPSDTGAYTTSTSVRFDWTAAVDAGAGVASYDLQVGTTPGGSNVFNANVGNVWNRTVTGANGQRLYARVRARDLVANTGAWSASSDGILIDTVAPTAPGRPTDPGVYTSATTVRFAWTGSTDAGSGIASYDLQVGTAPGGANIFNGNVGNVLSRTVAGGAHGLSLYARARSRDRAGNRGSWSPGSDGILIDTAKPRLTDARVNNYLAFEVTFNEAVTNATLASNYSCSRGLRVLGVQRLTDAQYRLHTTSQAPGTSYTVTVGGILRDRAGNPVDPAFRTRSFRGGGRTAVRLWQNYR